MSVAAIRSASGKGVIRPLRHHEQQLLHEHLLRLDPASRRDRFNGGVGDEFLATYATRCFEDPKTTVLAYMQDGVVRAAAELHVPKHMAPDAVPELAFSVERSLRRQGVGSALFEQLLTMARQRGYRRLRITTGADNQAMKALAHKFGAELTFASGEATGLIDLKRGKQPDVAPAPAVGGFELAREMVRRSQEMWAEGFRLYADLLEGGQRLRMH